MQLHKYLGQELLQAVLVTLTDKLQQLEQNPTISEDHLYQALKKEAHTLLYHFLTHHTIDRDMAMVCKRLLTQDDINRIKNISSYNHNKLNIIFYGK